MLLSILLFACVAAVGAATGMALWELRDGIHNGNHPATWAGVAIEALIGLVLLAGLLIALRAVNSRYDRLRRSRWTPGRWRRRRP